MLSFVDSTHALKARPNSRMLWNGAIPSFIRFGLLIAGKLKNGHLSPTVVERSSTGSGGVGIYSVFEACMVQVLGVRAIFS